MIKLFGTFLLSITLLVSSVAPIDAATYLQKWRVPSVPFTVTLVNMSVTHPELVAGLQKAADSWSASPTVDVVVGTRGKQIVKVYEAAYGTIYGIAWASITSKSGQGYIQTASVHFNSTHLEQYYGEGPSEEGLYRLIDAIVCHEVGHALGLAHVEIPDALPTCMTPGTTSDTPSEEDFVNLANRYP